MKKIFIILVISILSLSLVACGGSGSQSKDANTTKSVEPVIDATKFSRINSEQLVGIMGQPQKIDEWNFKSLNGTSYPTKTYIYNNNKYQFMVIDNSVVRLTVYSDKYNDNNGKSISYTDEKLLFNMFGITPSSNIKKVADTGVALRYQLVSDKIADFWITNIDKTNKTFDELKITYNLNYFN